MGEGIAIYSSDKYNLYGKKLKLPQSLYCSSTTHSVAMQGIKINNSIGEVLPPNIRGQISARTFSIQGNVEANKIIEVENLRSSIFAKLYGKPLCFFREEDDDRFYICYLQGNINITYNQGYNIGRVFTISFNLISYEGFAHSKEKTSIRLKDSCNLPYKGDIPTFPTIIYEKTYSAQRPYFYLLQGQYEVISITRFTAQNPHMKKNNIIMNVTKKDGIKLNRLMYKNGLLYVSYYNSEEPYVISNQLYKDVAPLSLTCPPFIEKVVHHYEFNQFATQLDLSDPTTECRCYYRELYY